MEGNHSQRIEQLLECMVHVIGRRAVPLEEVQKIVGKGDKQVKAFNLSDGARTQADVVKKAHINQSSLSSTSKRWVQNGVAFWIGESTDRRLLHIYPIPQPKSTPKKRTPSGKDKKRAR